MVIDTDVGMRIGICIGVVIVIARSSFLKGFLASLLPLTLAVIVLTTAVVVVVVVVAAVVVVVVVVLSSWLWTTLQLQLLLWWLW